MSNSRSSISDVFPMIATPVRVAICMLVLSGIASPVFGKVVSYGAGLETCESYLTAKDQQSAEEVTFVNWLSGYVTAFNATSNRVNNVLGDSNLQNTVLWLGAFCHLHAQTPVAVALDLRVVGARSTTARSTVEVITYGSGAKTCASYLEARQQTGADEDSYVDWLAGYLSAVNAFSVNTDDILGKSDFNAAILWLDEYCARQPGVRFAAAVTARVAAGMPVRSASDR